jgi:hypothetical protein
LEYQPFNICHHINWLLSFLFSSSNQLEILNDFLLFSAFILCLLVAIDIYSMTSSSQFFFFVGEGMRSVRVCNRCTSSFIVTVRSSQYHRTMSSSSLPSNSGVTPSAVASVAAVTNASFHGHGNALPRHRVLSEIGPDRPFGNTLLKDFPATFSVPISWGEQDLFQHGSLDTTLVIVHIHYR